MEAAPKRRGVAGAIAHAFIDSKLTPLIVGASLLLGLGAVVVLPREEEPQIVVPMIDIFVQMPGAGAKEVEERVTRPMEKLLWEVPGVEYIYSTSSPGASMCIVRFLVGENEEDAIVRLNQKLFANFDLIPPGASEPLVKPRSIDDVPILALTLASQRYDHYTLRRVAAQLHDAIKEVPDVSEVKIIGGPRREVRVVLDAARMAAHHAAPNAILRRLGEANRRMAAGRFASGNCEFLVETDGFLADADAVGRVVIGVYNNKPVYLRDVSTIFDGPEETADYVFYGAGPAEGHAPVLGDANDTAPGGAPTPAVTISVAKRKGTNATTVTQVAIDKVRELGGKVVPDGVLVSLSRNYGETAREKSNELLYHMALAVVSVTVLIAFTLGLRESGTVAIAIPVTLALTLVIFYFYGYTINRVTLFALIFSIGILVDDAIVVVENIVRHYHLPESAGLSPQDAVIEAVDEVGNPTLLATAAVIAAILPMAFVRGLMGPYMEPIPVGASAAMVFSVLVSFIVTPWAAVRLLKRAGAERAGHHDRESALDRLYRRVMRPLLIQRVPRAMFLAGVVFLLLAACALVPLQRVLVKMLPFDNKSEFQIVIDMPEGTTLEKTAAVTRDIADFVRAAPEVTDYQMYIGAAAPHNFNGLVRHYFLRKGANVADIQVNLASRDERAAQSHDIAKRLRPGVQEIARKHNARVKVAEVPPGPPVLQTLVAEIYGPDYAKQIELAQQVLGVFERTEGVVDADSYIEADQTKYRFVVDHEKAALNGVSAADIATTLRAALDGTEGGLVHIPTEKEDAPIRLQLDRAQRSGVDGLRSIKVQGENGGLVSIGELARVENTTEDKGIYHKNLMPVVYVTADVGGTAESPV
ncbi:MAG: efflux RND transporter permease subunit, partial [Candidatus Hydrogenedentes bacterium]|nr:efflux RND transporter permease subunit [Candidatus Hydrogenedentota bacterium]